MNNEKIIRKIKHCLALSQSANVNEARSALRQAQILMQKHNISESDTLTLDIQEAQAKASTKSSPPFWQYQLAKVICQAMGCEYLCESHKRGSIGHSAFKFIGFDYQAEIASYAFEVLLRQLLKERKDFISTLSNRYKRTEKKQLGDNFCLGWVYGVNEVVQKFELSAQQHDAIQAYQAQKYDVKIERTTPNLGNPKGYQQAMAMGHAQGQEAKLHRGTNHHDTERLTHE